MLLDEELLSASFSMNLVFFVDLVPKVIAIGVMMATSMKKRQSPARTYGLWRSRLFANLNRSSLVSLLLRRFFPTVSF